MEKMTLPSLDAFSQPYSASDESIEEYVKRRSFEAYYLYELSQKIGYTLDFEEMFHILQISLHQFLNFELSVSLVIEDPSSDRYNSVMTFYLPQPITDELKMQTREKLLGIFSKLIQHPLTDIQVVELRGDGYYQDPTPLNELGSFFNLPLIVQGKPIGLLYVASRRKQAFNENHLALLYKVAEQTSNAVLRLQEVLARERAHLEAVIAGLGEGILLLDKNFRVRLNNPAAIQILKQLNYPLPVPGRPYTNLGDLLIQGLFNHPEGPESGLQLLNTLGEDLGPFVQVWGAAPEVRGEPTMLLVLRDITQEHHHLELLHHLSITDSLTGLSNRRHFFDALENDIARAQRYHYPLALILLDLDHLKYINDTFGHPEGDKMIRETARAMLQVSRHTDLPARYGGDEFVFLLPHTSLAGAKRLAERLLRNIRRIQLPDGTPLSISAGGTVLASNKENGDALVARADLALYQAKQAGRGCVVSIPPPEEDPGG